MLNKVDLPPKNKARLKLKIFPNNYAMFVSEFYSLDHSFLSMLFSLNVVKVFVPQWNPALSLFYVISVIIICFYSSFYNFNGKIF